MKTKRTNNTQNIYSGYLTSVISACDNMTSAAGDYYYDALTLISSYFSAEQTALSSLTSTILSKTVNFVNSFHNANSVCAESITSSFYDFIGANNSAAVTAALEETTYQDQMIDAEIAYYKALETAKANETIEISQANSNTIERVPS